MLASPGIMMVPRRAAGSGAPPVDLPALDLNFLSGALPADVTFTRASTAWYFNSAGVLTAAAANAPRFDYDPATLQLKGMLVERAGTNLVLNSSVLATQSVTVTAVAHTLSFFGTGTVTLTGASTAGPLVGTGASNRVSLTFTPTAGSLTLTVTGSVTIAQLEVGSYATSPIVTAGTTVTRAAENATLSTLGAWFNAATGTALVECSMAGISSATGTFLSLDDNTSNERFTLRAAAGALASLILDGGVSQATLSMGTVTANTVQKAALAYALNDFAAVRNGGTVATDPAGTLPTVTRMSIGYRLSGEQIDGHMRRVRYWNTRKTNAEIQALTT